MRNFFGAALLSLFFSSALYAGQADIPVNVKAETLRYFEDTGQVEALGSVEVKFKEVTIYADRLQMDSATNIATAEGNVRLVADDYRGRSSRLVYDANLGTSQFTDFKTKLLPGNLRGPLYVDARRLTDEKNVMRGGPGDLTTCDREPPHFFMVASRVQYFPKDHIDGWNAVLYMGEIPVLWLPYFWYDLKGEQKRNWIFGHNEVEGDFIKSFWGYPGGLLLLDYMEKKGIGYGTETAYGLAALGLGRLYLYHVDEKDTGKSDWAARIEHEKKINPWTTLKLNQRYTDIYLVPGGRVDQTALGLNLNYADAARWNLRFDTLDDRVGQNARYALQFDQSLSREALSYFYNYDFAKSDPRWIRKSQRLSLRRPLSDRVSFSTLTNYYHSVAREGDSGEEKVEPQIELLGTEPGYSWRYTQNWFLDLRRDLYPDTQRYEFLERQPEIEVRPNALDLKYLTLQPTFGYGYYREVKNVPELPKKRDFGTQRYRTTMDLNRSIPLAKGTTMALGAGIDQFLYGPGDQMYAYRERASLNSDNGSFFRNDINYKKGITDGNTPFFFDKLGTSYHDITERMTFYHQSKFSWSFEGGRNWQTAKWFDVMTNLMFSPDTRARLNLNTGWDIENRRYKDLVGSLHLAPYTFFNLDLSAVQDMNGVGLRSANALYDIYFLEKAPNQWHFRLGQVFDPQTGEFKVRDIMVVKDLHCWEMRYQYSDYRKEFSLVFSLKAMPEEPLGFATGRGFYFQGFDELEKETKGMKMEGEVKRY